MTTDRTEEYLFGLLRGLCALPGETEWVELKSNKVNPQEIGEYISALSNSAALCRKTNAYLVWGVVDEKDSPVVSRIIKQAGEAGFIKLYDPKANRKIWRYVSIWA